MAQSALDQVFLYFDSGDNLAIACTSEITPGHTAQATTSPVEVGSDITDHVRVDPDTLSLSIFLSELVGQEEKSAYDPDFVGDHIKVRERLIQARNQRDPVSIDLGPDKGVYPDMIITAVSPVWTEGMGKSPVITLQLLQIVYATTKTRKIAPKTRAAFTAGAVTGVGDKPALFNQGAAGANLGNINTKALSPLDILTNKVKDVTQKIPGLPNWARL